MKAKNDNLIDLYEIVDWFRITTVKSHYNCGFI